MANSLRLAFVGGFVLALSACGVHQTIAPSPLGTSTLSLALDMTATPDSISQDGASQSSIVVTAHGPDGAPESGVALHLDMQVGDVVQDFGTLNARNVVTGNDGRATAIYTAPPTSPLAGGTTTMISIVATPSGTNAQASNARNVSIRLVPPGVILPPAQTPVALFTFTPQPVSFNTPVTFDASTSCAVQLVNSVCPPAIPGTPTVGSIVSYSWNFGDGSSGSGKIVSHTFALSTATSFKVTLTVTNDRGLSATTTPPQDVPVSASPAPSGDWVSSPVAAVVNQAILFNADGIKPALGHTIVQYNWNFGDNSANQTASGFQVTHTFTLPGDFAVILSVLDDTGQKTVFPHSPFHVDAGLPTAVLTLAKTGGVTIQADGSGSFATGTFRIATYTFVWGDGTQTVSSTPVASHTYAALVPPALTETFTVTLRVTDDAVPTRTSVNPAAQVITVP